jgi:hypothetical protein
MGSTFPERKYDIHHQWPTPHAKQALQSWSKFNSHIKAGIIQIDGQTLDLAAVVAVARLIHPVFTLYSLYSKFQTDGLFRCLPGTVYDWPSLRTPASSGELKRVLRPYKAISRRDITSMVSDRTNLPSAGRINFPD